jgi:hypothetical protein
MKQSESIGFIHIESPEISVLEVDGSHPNPPKKEGEALNEVISALQLRTNEVTAEIEEMLSKTNTESLIVSSVREIQPDHETCQDGPKLHGNCLPELRRDEEGDEGDDLQNLLGMVQTDNPNDDGPEGSITMSSVQFEDEIGEPEGFDEVSAIISETQILGKTDKTFGKESTGIENRIQSRSPRPNNWKKTNNVPEVVEIGPSNERKMGRNQASPVKNGDEVARNFQMAKVNSLSHRKTCVVSGNQAATELPSKLPVSFAPKIDSEAIIKTRVMLIAAHNPHIRSSLAKKYAQAAPLEMDLENYQRFINKYVVKAL